MARVVEELQERTPLGADLERRDPGVSAVEARLELVLEPDGPADQVLDQAVVGDDRGYLVRQRDELVPDRVQALPQLSVRRIEPFFDRARRDLAEHRVDDQVYVRM